MRLNRILIGLVVAFGLLAIYPAWKIVPHFSDRPTGPPVGLKNCARVATAPGPEDLAIDWATGRVYVSTFDRRAPKGADGRAPNGRLLRFDLDAPAAQRDAVVTGPEVFRPHGISLERGADGRAQRLLAINHADGGSQVEFFAIGPGGDLTHEGAWIPGAGEPRPPRANDLAATGQGGFVLTNLAPLLGFWGELAMVTGLPLGPVFSRTASDAAVSTATRLFIPNGVAILDGGRRAVVAEFGGRRLVSYDRDPVGGALVRTGHLDLPGAPDNITVAPDGALWVAVQPHFGEMLAHRGDADARASSRIVRVAPDLSDWRLMLDAPATDAAAGAARISSASVAAALGDRFVVGGVFDAALLICDVAASDGRTT